MLIVYVGGKVNKEQTGFCSTEGGEARGLESMSEGTSSRSHERRARGGGEASLMKRTLCSSCLCDAQTHAGTCAWAREINNCTPLILPVLWRRRVVDGRRGRARGRRKKASAWRRACTASHFPPLQLPSSPSSHTARQTLRCKAREGKGRRGLGGQQCLGLTSLPPSIIIHLLVPFFVMPSS